MNSNPKPNIIELPKKQDPRGNLSFLENYSQIPFEIMRVFWTYDVPGGEERGGHAFKNQEEVIIALSGSFDVCVTLKTGEIQKYQLNRPHFGLYLPTNIWRHMENFSTNSLSLHLSNSVYREEAYIRSFEEYRNL